jgi:hypothetical protein
VRLLAIAQPAPESALRFQAKMAWLTLADATGAIEAAIFPQPFARLADQNNGELALREGPLWWGAVG